MMIVEKHRIQTGCTPLALPSSSWWLSRMHASVHMVTFSGTNKSPAIALVAGFCLISLYLSLFPQVHFFKTIVDRYRWTVSGPLLNSGPFISALIVSIHLAYNSALYFEKCIQEARWTFIDTWISQQCCTNCIVYMYTECPKNMYMCVDILY